MNTRKLASLFIISAVVSVQLPVLPAFASQRTADSLGAYWKFDETSGTSAADSSGDGNTGTLTNSPTISTDVPTTVFTNARSLSFDGSNDYVQITDSNAIDFDYNQNFAVSAWVKIPSANQSNTVAGDNDIIEKWDLVASRYPFVIRYLNHTDANAGKIYVGRYDGTHVPQITSTSTYNDDAWHHIVFMKNGSTLSLVIDGGTPQTATDTTDTTTTNASALYIGRRGGSGSNYFKGLVDDVRIYNRALSLWEISQLAGGNHIQAYWKGRSGTGLERKQNWSGSYVPDPYSRLVIRSVATGSLVLTGAIKATSLIINTGATMNLNGTGFTMNDSGTFTNYGTLMLKNSETLTNLTVPTTKGTIMINGTGSTTGFKTGNSYYNLTLNDGLVGYLAFDETSGTRAADGSGYGNSGSLVNSVSISTTVAPTNFHNKRSLSFDGTDDYVSAPTNGFNFGTTPRSIAGWIKPTSSATTRVPFAYGNCNLTGGLSSGSFGMYLDSSNVVNFWGCADDYSSGVAVTNGIWSHIAATYDGTNVRVYVNGSLAGAPTAKTLVTPTLPVWEIGSAHLLDSGNYYFPGQIDDVRVYKRTLRPGEVSALAAGNQPSLQLGTITLNAALDVNNHLTLNGGTLDVSSSNYGVTVGGSWRNNGGKFAARKGTVTLDGSSSGLELLTGGQRFNAVTFNGAGGTWNTRDRLTSSGTLTLTAGTLDASGSYVIRAGTISQTSGSFTPRSGTVILTSPSAATATITSTLNALDIEDSTENGLVGYWKFDEGTNTGAILDSSGYGNNGVRTGTGLVWTGAVLPSAIAFDNPFAMKFNRSNDFISMGDISRLEVESSPPFAISLWFRPEWTPSLNSVLALLAKGNGGDAGYGFQYQNNGGTYYLNLSKYGVADQTVALGSALTLGTWYHLAAVQGTTSVEYFLNGTSIGTYSNSSAFNTSGTHAFIIGSQTNGTNRTWGHLDDVRLYNRTLTSDEVTNLARGRYAAGNSSTSTFTLGSNLSAYSLELFSGNLDTAAYELDLSYPLSLLRGDGMLTLGSADATLAGLILSGSTVTGGSGDLNMEWDIQIYTGSLVAPSGTIFLDGQWLKYGGYFDSNSGSIVLEGANPTLEGTTTFYNLTKNTAGSVNFGTGDTFSVNGTLTLQGTAGSLLTLQSRTAGYTWTINPSGTRNISYVAVQDSINSNALAIDCSGTCTNNGNNTNWIFPSSASSSTAGNTSGGVGGRRGGGTVLQSALRAHAAIQEQYRRAIVIDDAQNNHPSTIKKPDTQPTDDLPQRIGTYGIVRERNRLVLDTGDVRLIYKDVIADSWYAPYVANVIQENIARGYKDANGKLTGEFGVAKPVTHAEILKMALEAGKKSDTKAAPPRNASAKDSWASSYVGIAEQLQLKVFESDLNVHTPATRAEVIQTILEVFGIPVGKTLSTFDDVPETHRYNSAIATATFYGLIDGDTDVTGNPLNTFRPDAYINRAEVAKIIALAKELLKN